MPHRLGHTLFASARRGVWLIALALAFVVCLVVAWVALYEKNVIIETERDRLALFARVLEDQVARTFESTSRVGSELADELSHVRPESLESLRPALQKAISSVSAIRSLSILDPDGRILMSSHVPDEGLRIDLEKLGPIPGGDNSALAPILPVRYLSDLDQRPTGEQVLINSLPMTRSVGGGHKYYLVTLLNPDYLSNLQALALGDTGYAAYLVLTQSNQVVAGFNGASRIGDRVYSNVELPGNAQPRVYGTYTYMGIELGAGDQLLAMRSSRHWPVTTIVERPMTRVLGDWVGLLTWFALVAGVAILVIIIMAFLAMRSIRARDRARSSLVEQLSFTEKLLEISPLPIYLVDAQGVIIVVNQALESFLGIKREQLLNQPTSRFLSEADQQSLQINNQSLLREGGQVSYERRLAMPDGTERDVLLNKVVVSNDDGLPRGVLTVVLDVTRFRDAERATLQARDAAENASRSKSEFISNMSHELRTPLQSILGFSELGLLRVKDDDQVAGMLHDIHASGQRMLTLVNDLLDIAKIESSVDQVVFSDVDLRHLIDTVVRELEPQRLAKHLEFDVQGLLHAIVVHADAQRLHQVVRNVMANAIKFSPLNARIEIELKVVANQRVRLTVLDQGCGVPPDELEKIFDPFVQSSLTKDGSGGTGLGLAICRRILRAHEGTIHAENRPQGGAAFKIELPMKDERSGLKTNQIVAMDEL